MGSSSLTSSSWRRFCWNLKRSESDFDSTHLLRLNQIESDSGQAFDYRFWQRQPRLYLVGKSWKNLIWVTHSDGIDKKLRLLLEKTDLKKLSSKQRHQRQLSCAIILDWKIKMAIVGLSKLKKWPKNFYRTTIFFSHRFKSRKSRFDCDLSDHCQCLTDLLVYQPFAIDRSAVLCFATGSR